MELFQYGLFFGFPGLLAVRADMRLSYCACVWIDTPHLMNIFSLQPR